MLEISNTIILMIDMQEKLVSATSAEFEVKQAEKILKASEILDIPVLVSEQYPKGLGQTVPSLRSEKQHYIEKTAFSIFNESGFAEIIKGYNRKQIVLFGIETHICVYQTAMDLVKNGYEVILVKDACKSRKEFEYETGIELMRQNGVKISSVEIVLFELLKTSKHTNFKEIQQLIK